MFIDQIHIKNFRSIVDKKISAKNINVFVGNNDVGKSNILKALNLFFNGITDYATDFNFEKDYSLYAKKQQNKADEISVSLRFVIPDNFIDKGKKITWVKIWRIDGERKDKERLKGVSGRSKSENWIRKISFRYVPAIRSELFFSSLLKEMYQVFSNTVQKDLKRNSKRFIKGLQQHTLPLKAEIKEILNIDSLLSLPSDLSDLFSTLDFNTSVEGADRGVSLRRRGDGIKVRHVPAILKFLADKERVHHKKGDVREDTIWGYEEPENNLELRAAFEVAKQIKKYGERIQMFVTTHSPVFYRLGFENDCYQAFEVFKMVEDRKSFSNLQIVNDSEQVDGKMGLLPLITPFIVKKEKKIQEIIEKNAELQAQLNLMDKDVVLFVEGKHDKDILENAWEKLNPDRQADFIIHNLYDCFGIENVLKRGEVFFNDPDKIYIGMLDFDNAYECFDRLEKHKDWKRHRCCREKGLSLIHKNKKGGLFLLPVPDHRLAYADEEYKKDSCLTIELLFEDGLLKGFTKKKRKVGGSEVFYMPDEKKKKFAEQTINFTYDNFRYFKIIFEKILSIVADIEVRDL